MSDNFMILIPADPTFVPDLAAQTIARARLLEIAPGADVSVEVRKNVTIFHCVEHFSRILCPSCRSEISVEWWREKMDDDYDDGFKLAQYLTPCCGTAHTLHELVYEGTQGFGRFSMTATNAGIEPLDDKYRKEFEEILGIPLRVIYVRI
jgi:hypothetical protein